MKNIPKIESNIIIGYSNFANLLSKIKFFEELSTNKLEISIKILKKLEKNSFKISLPVVKKNNVMDFYEWSFMKPLKTSRQGIPEPYTVGKVFPDVLIVPLVGFDKNKYR